MPKERIRQARKGHLCDDFRTGCPRRIKPGDRYREHTIYPGHDVITVPVPTRMRQCEACADRSGHPLDEQVSA